MIDVEHLSKWYGAYRALHNISFHVEKGEILGFLGPNGAGKTTTMRIITGYIPPTAGTVSVAGFDVGEKSLDARRHLGYLPETVPLYTEFTPYEYLDFRGRIDGIHNGRERKARIYEVMDRLNIRDVANKQISALSRGYRQRVGLAQAMLHNPDVLILDEPTVGLDPVQITGVRDLIKELGQDHTVVLSTHLLPEVSMICDRVLIVNRGHLVAFDTPLRIADTGAQAQSVQVEAGGSPSAVLAALRAVAGVGKASVAQPAAAGSHAPATATYLTDAKNLPAGAYTYQIDGKSGLDIRPGVSEAVVNSGNQLFEMKLYMPTLEEAFISAVSRDDAAAVDDYADDEYYDGENAEAVEEPVEAVAAPAPRERVVTKRRSRG